MYQNAKLRKGDKVKVITGKEKGKIGQIVKVFKKSQKVILDKINLVKRFRKANAKSKGGIFEKEAPIHISNIKLMCSHCVTAVRFNFNLIDSGKKIRICNNCHELI